MNLKTLIAIITLLLLGELCTAEPATLSYTSDSRIIAKLYLNYHSSKFIVELINLKISDEKNRNIIMPFGKGFLYHKTNHALYAEGFTQRELEKEFLSQKFRKQFLVFDLLFPKAFALNDCAPKNDQIISLARYGEQIKVSGVSKFIEKCNFSISQIIEEQVNTAKEMFNGVLSGSIWQQISESISAIRTILPSIHDRLLVPLQSIMKNAPQLAEHMVCSFSKAKIGQLALAGITGGSGLPLALSKTAVEMGELIQKITLLQRNKSALALVTKLSKLNLLDEETIQRLLRMTPDVPEEYKKLNIQFRNPGNLTKHFEKHKAEMDFQSEEDYEKAAAKFVRSSNDPNTAVYPLANGDFNKLNFSTGEYVVTNKYGNIITYFKLSCKKEHEKMMVFLYSKEATPRGICADR